MTALEIQPLSFYVLIRQFIKICYRERRIINSVLMSTIVNVLILVFNEFIINKSLSVATRNDSHLHYIQYPRLKQDKILFIKASYEVMLIFTYILQYI